MSTSFEQAEKALVAWKRRFNDQHHELGSDDPEPFKLGQPLGGGGNGAVYTTELDGIPLALKRTYTRNTDKRHLNEIQILRQLSEVRHKHVVTLIGSCVRKRNRIHVIDIIMYPVAQCDLADFLHDLDILMRWAERSAETKEEREHAGSAAEMLSAFDNGPKQSFTLDSQQNVKDVILGAQHIVFRSFGCIAQAVAYMHHQKIRHKDLKPSQILLSPDGLWLTDFGWSLNTAELAQSDTSNGYQMTVKYQAPERANGTSCGRAEDIFALGCTFLEMALRLTRSGADARKTWTPKGEVRWSFQANLSQLEDWLAPLSSEGSFVPPELLPLLRRMMAYKPEDRPSIDGVIEALSCDTCSCSPPEKVDPPPETVDPLPEKVNPPKAEPPPAAKETIPSTARFRQKRTTYLWDCCQCGQPSNMVARASCTSCGYERCANCLVKKVVLR